MIFHNQSVLFTLRRVVLVAACLTVVVSFHQSVLAQSDLPVIDTVKDIDFDRPEAWALKYFTSASLLTSIGPVESRQRGSVDLSFEVMSIPHLDTEQRTVGFNGRKEENLNRSPAWGRVRASFGLGADFELTLAAVPPVDIDGVQANLYAAALARPLWQGRRSSLGLRLHAQTGDVEGDFTCSSTDAASPPGSPDNLFGCEAESADEVTLDYYGAEVVWSRTFDGARRPSVHISASVQEMDLEFQVNAQTFGFLDQSLLLADGSTWSVSAGSSFKLGERNRLGVELFYSPLDVLRPGATASENDDLLNLRFLITRRLR